MEIKIYKTHEIDDATWQKIVAGYNASFEGHQTTKENLIIGYKSNHFGFSYHAVCRENEAVIGFNSIVPYYYFHNKEKIVFGLSGTTFVLKEYRKDIFIFQDMYNSLKEYCARENMVAFLGVPNSNSYQYSIKLLKCKEIAKLSYYILPVKIFNITGKKSLSGFNFLSHFCAYMWLIINGFFSLIHNSKEHIADYRLDINGDFYTKRFFASRYRSIRKKNAKFTYTVANEDGVSTAYIMDYRDSDVKRYKTLIWAVWYILKHEKIDLVMYVGTMNLKQCLLMKVPLKMEPKKLPLTYNLLKNISSDKYSDIADVRNWDFSLINLDVR
jgi:hypothetical protein